jgi:multiple sugar transport system substrate-binding protein
MKRILVLLMILAIFVNFAVAKGEVEKDTVITIWYEGGDARLPFFKAVEAEMQKDYPNYRIDAVTFDNATFMTKVLQTVTATGGVDLVFNDASRLLTINQQSGGGFADLSGVFEADSHKALVTSGDLKLSSTNDALIVYPINRSIAALGVKTDVSGVVVNEETLPKTWDKFETLGAAFKSAGMPGFTMHLGSDPGQIFNLFFCGSGMSDIWLNSTPESQIVSKLDYYKRVVSAYAGTNAFWDKDATSEGFAEMYNKILSSSVGMFRVGNWNAGNWDKPGSGVGEYTVTTWPSMKEGMDSGLVLLNTRGLAMPKNAKNQEAAKIFLSYVLSKEAQSASFATMGSCIDVSVVDPAVLSKNQRIFFDPTKKLFPIDTYVAQYTYYPQINEVFEKGLTRAFNASPTQIENTLVELSSQIDKAILENK